MRGHAVRAGWTAVAAAIALLALPAGASAFQDVSIESGAGGSKTLHIVGDVTKTPDEVTLTFDSVNDEYVITHDIVLVPPDCIAVGPGPPFKEIHCPARGINHIVIETGKDKDLIKTSNIRITGLVTFINPGAALFFPQDLISMEIKAGTGNDQVADTPASSAPSQPPGGGAYNQTDLSIDMGGGSDKVDLPGGGKNVIHWSDGTAQLVTGDGDNTITGDDVNAKMTLGNGNNMINFGDGRSTLLLGDGNNNIVLGDGNSKVTVGGGSDTATFGNGTSKFIGGAGVDIGRFGAGNSTFIGGVGNDRATFQGGANTFTGGVGNDFGKLGGGDDNFTGGPGNDRGKGGADEDRLIGGPGRDSLFGGSDNDNLLGNGGFDLLIGGPGPADRCLLGPGGGRTISCELP